MKFAIASCEFWAAKGYNITEWRKSTDGTKALVHLEFAKILVPDISDHDGIELYDHADDAFSQLLSSDEWSQPVELTPPTEG